MKRTNILISILMAAIFLTVQVIAVGAAPTSQDTTPITGIVTNISIETDTGTTTVVVTLTDEMGATRTVNLSLVEALALGLVKDDGTGNPIPDDSIINTKVIIDTTDTPEEEEKQHPVGSAIADFFSESLGVDYEMIMEYHDDGTGFGVIAQALWMTDALEGDSETFAAILEAKKNKDFSGITLPDGSTPKNWGQFRKAVMSNRDKAKENLGAIMSGRAKDQQDNLQLSPKDNGKGHDKDKGKGKDKDKNKNK